MSMITRDQNGRATEEFFRATDSPCNVCGGSSDAMWSCQKNIYVCRDCALYVLPRLLADAMCAARRPIDPERIEKDIRLTFWEALALDLAVRRKDDRAAVARAACQCKAEAVEEDEP
jgi:hypothetical protein